MAIKTSLPAESRPAIRRVRDISGREMVSFSAFSKVVTHRIGSLISSIEGYTDLLLDAVPDTADRENAFRILESVRRMEAVLEDIQSFRNDVQVQLRSLPADTLVSNAFRLLSDVESSRTRLQVNLPDGVHVLADPQPFRQALLAVLRNALEATDAPDTPVSVTVDRVEATNELRIQVYNVGQLSPDTVRSRIFEPFYTTKAHNLGVGLTIARRILHLHGGSINLTSGEEELGTEFTLRIPLATD
jgi:signal transduction histidine kinase